MNKKKPGHVYILTNRSMPGIVKIGMTTRDPVQRARELSSSTGVPVPFRLAYSAEVPDCSSAEASIHRILGKSRLSGRREFFRISANSARAALEREIAGFKGGRRRRYRSVLPSLLFSFTSGVACYAYLEGKILDDNMRLAVTTVIGAALYPCYFNFMEPKRRRKR